MLGVLVIIVLSYVIYISCQYYRIEDNKIYIEIPLTSQSGKARVKIRNSFYEYGLPTATKQNPF